MKLLLPKLLLNKRNKISLEYIGAFLLIVFCNFWIYHAKPIVPLYYFFFISLLILPFVVINHKKVSVSQTQILSLICGLYIFFVSFFHESTSVNTVLHSGASFFFYFISIFYLKYLNKNQVLFISKCLFILSLVYISFETFWRWTHPTLSRVEDIVISGEAPSFYLFKISSFMFHDSNFVSLITLIMTFYSLYLYKYVEKKFFYKIMCITFTLLTIFTLSRAAILATIVTFGIYFSTLFLKKHLYLFIKYKPKITLKLLLYLVLATIIIYFFLYGLFLFLLDGSMITKIEIFQSLNEYIKSVSITSLLFGIGSNLELIIYYFNRATHALIPTYIVWYGFVELFLVTLFWSCIIKDTKGKGLLIIIPIFLVGISLSVIIIHIFYVTLALITYFERYSKTLKRKQSCH